MSEKLKDENVLPKHELLEVIDSCIYVISTLSELDTNLTEDKEDAITLRKHSYKLAYAAQRKLLQYIKADKM